MPIRYTTEPNPFDSAKELRDTDDHIKADIPIGRDSAQTALMTQALAGGTFDLTLVEDDGYTVTCATAKVSGFALDNSGDGIGKLSFDFKNSGTFNIAASV